MSDIEAYADYCRCEKPAYLDCVIHHHECYGCFNAKAGCMTEVGAREQQIKALQTQVVKLREAHQQNAEVYDEGCDVHPATANTIILIALCAAFSMIMSRFIP